MFEFTRPACSSRRRLAGPLTAIVWAGLVAGCASVPGEPPPPRYSAAPPAFPVDQLVGKWGIASYREEKDRRRTETKAKEQCKLPYVITKGPTDGVMMHVADDPKLYELTLKGGPDGKTYLGFAAPPGDSQDRVVLSHSAGIMVMRFVDEEVHKRYGIFVYVRCPG